MLRHSLLIAMKEPAAATEPVSSVGRGRPSEQKVSCSSLYHAPFLWVLAIVRVGLSTAIKAIRGIYQVSLLLGDCNSWQIGIETAILIPFTPEFMTLALRSLGMGHLTWKAMSLESRKSSPFYPLISEELAGGWRLRFMKIFD